MKDKEEVKKLLLDFTQKGVERFSKSDEIK